jgi:hypothetical protein
MNTERYIEFLEGLIHGRQRPLVLIVDHASFHGSHKLGNGFERIGVG